MAAKPPWKARIDVVFRNLLILGSETPALRRAVPFLQRAEFQIHRIHDARLTVELVETTQFDLIAVRFPLEELGLCDLVDAVRSTSSLSRSAAFLVVTGSAHLAKAASYVGHGVNRVVNLDDPSDSLLHAIADLIAISPRKTVRLMVQIDLVLHSGTQTVLAITQNISTAGMLVRNEGRELPVGSRIHFQLALPDEGPAIAGEAEVVRHAFSGEEHFDGVGVRFISMDSDGLRRLEAFITMGLKEG